jgi:hypothetical protein
MAGRDARGASSRGMPSPEQRPHVLATSQGLASSLVMNSRLAWDGAVRGRSRRASPRTNRRSRSRPSRKQQLPAHARPPAQISQSWIRGAPSRRGLGLRRTGCAGWPGSRSLLDGRPEFRTGGSERGLRRVKPGPRLRRDTCETMSRRSRTNSDGVIRDRGTGRRRPRGTARRSAGGSCDGRNGRRDRDKNSAPVRSDRKFRQQLGRSSGPFLAGCRRRAKTGL